MKHRLGIVLSGGGLRGIAHIGVLKALDEHGLAPDCISATSSGAIVGALYAAGYSPEEMLGFFRDKNPLKVSKLAMGKPGLLDTDKSVADFLEYFPEDSFAALSKPLFITATDIVNARAEIFESGPLISVILASSSVPVLFTPTQVDGRWFSDGGIIDNFPVEPVKALCDVLVGVYASPLRKVDKEALNSTVAVTQRALEVGMYFSSRRKFHHCDVMICPQELVRFGMLDSKHLRTIFDIGYAAGKQNIDAIREVVRANAL